MQIKTSTEIPSNKQKVLCIFTCRIGIVILNLEFFAFKDSDWTINKR